MSFLFNTLFNWNQDENQNQIHKQVETGNCINLETMNESSILEFLNNNMFSIIIFDPVGKHPICYTYSMLENLLNDKKQIFYKTAKNKENAVIKIGLGNFYVSYHHLKQKLKQKNIKFFNYFLSMRLVLLFGQLLFHI